MGTALAVPLIPRMVAEESLEERAAVGPRRSGPKADTIAVQDSGETPRRQRQHRGCRSGKQIAVCPVEEGYGGQTRIMPRPIEKTVGLVGMGPERAAPGTHLIVGTRTEPRVGADQRKAIPAQINKAEGTTEYDLGQSTGSQVHGAAQRTKGRSLRRVQAEHRLKQTAFQTLPAIEDAVRPIRGIESVVVTHIEMDCTVLECMESLPWSSVVHERQRAHPQVGRRRVQETRGTHRAPCSPNCRAAASTEATSPRRK
jgi:hypothetical protein